MPDTLDTFKRADSPLPDKMLRWHLYGSGLENLGKNGTAEVVDVPKCGPDELLIRQDACGLCFSDTKVIALGNNHPRMTGRNLMSDPATLGHEVSCTVVRVGSSLAGKFKVGQRFIIQADVFYKGQSIAYGYAIPGGLAEYSIIGPPILDGDEGCYLLPLNDATGYVESALVEPWACVVSAYVQKHRESIKNEGSMLVVVGNGSYLSPLKDLISSECKPACLHILAPHLNLETDMQSGDVSRDVALYHSLESLIPAIPDGGYDDIILVGSVSPDDVEAVAALLSTHGICNFIQPPHFARKISLDIGRIHYNWHSFISSSSNSASSAYKEERTAELKAGGKAWFVGAGGPMGQMHVQIAIQMKTPPSLIVAHDVDAARLESVIDRFGALAESKSIKLVALNPNGMSTDQFDKALEDITGGTGFNDIVSLVPVASVIEHAANHLAIGGWFNIFAGVARGTMANIDLNSITEKKCRFIGSSGSSLADMQHTLQKVEDGSLSTNASLAAIGGMETAKEGLAAVKEGRFTGKTLIFPLIHDLPLTPLKELETVLPTVYSKLQDGKFWTKEAEEELLRIKLGGSK